MTTESDFSDLAKANGDMLPLLFATCYNAAKSVFADPSVPAQVGITNENIPFATRMRAAILPALILTVRYGLMMRNVGDLKAENWDEESRTITSKIPTFSYYYGHVRDMAFRIDQHATEVIGWTTRGAKPHEPMLLTPSGCPPSYKLLTSYFRSLWLSGGLCPGTRVVRRSFAYYRWRQLSLIGRDLPAEELDTWRRVTLEATSPFFGMPSRSDVELEHTDLSTYYDRLPLG